MKDCLLKIKRRICESLALGFGLYWAGLSPEAALIEGALGMVLIHLCVWMVLYLRLSSIDNRKYKKRKNQYENQ